MLAKRFVYAENRRGPSIEKTSAKSCIVQKKSQRIFKEKVTAIVGSFLRKAPTLEN